MSIDKQETDRQTDLVLEVAPPEVGHLKKLQVYLMFNELQVYLMSSVPTKMFRNIWSYNLACYRNFGQIPSQYWILDILIIGFEAVTKFQFLI